jgi:hypothetical protein
MIQVRVSITGLCVLVYRSKDPRPQMVDASPSDESNVQVWLVDEGRFCHHHSGPSELHAHSGRLTFRILEHVEGLSSQLFTASRSIDADLLAEYPLGGGAHLVIGTPGQATELAFPNPAPIPTKPPAPGAEIPLDHLLDLRDLGLSKLRSDWKSNVRAIVSLHGGRVTGARMVRMLAKKPGGRSQIVATHSNGNAVALADGLVWRGEVAGDEVGVGLGTDTLVLAPEWKAPSTVSLAITNLPSHTQLDQPALGEHLCGYGALFEETVQAPRFGVPQSNNITACPPGKIRID